VTSVDDVELAVRQALVEKLGVDGGHRRVSGAADDLHRRMYLPINPVIDRLQADPRRVSDDLDAVEAAADALQHDESSDARQSVVGALLALERNLLAHLDYEELSIESTVLRLRE
jgi:hypothetical protein